MSDGRPSEAEREQLRDAVYGTRVAEFASVRDDKPVTYPLTSLYDERRDTLIVTSPPAFARKVDAVRAHPEVSVLVPGDDPALVMGKATVHDEDLSGNGWYIQGLALDEPDSPKVDLFRNSEELLRTRLGSALLDWYGLRIVVEIHPTSVRELGTEGSTATVSRWDAIDLTAREARKYHRAVVSVVDADGYPVSWPVSTVDPAGDEARLDVPDDTAIPDGEPACLLLHWYAPDLETMGQRIVLGRCRSHEDGVRFDPGSTWTWRKETTLDSLAMVLSGKRRTRRYFDETSPFRWTWPLTDGSPRRHPPWNADEHPVE